MGMKPQLPTLQANLLPSELLWEKVYEVTVENMGSKNCTKVEQKLSVQHPHIKCKILIEETDNIQWRCHQYAIFKHSPLKSSQLAVSSSILYVSTTWLFVACLTSSSEGNNVLTSVPSRHETNEHCHAPNPDCTGDGPVFPNINLHFPI